LNYFRQHGNKVTPQKTIDGTNLREAYKTYEYLLNHFHFSDLRKSIIKGYYLSLIKKTKFVSEDIRWELFSCWGGDDGFSILVLLGEFVSLIRNRCGIYL
jgi:hypothetical protein